MIAYKFQTDRGVWYGLLPYWSPELVGEKCDLPEDAKIEGPSYESLEEASEARVAVLCRSTYQSELLAGRASWAGSDLRGKARKYGATYAASRIALAERMYDAGLLRGFVYSRKTGRVVPVMAWEAVPEHREGVPAVHRDARLPALE